jgi:hypothetical protein
MLSWANPADIPAGTALGASQLDATSTVPGTFAFTPPAGTILDVGQGQVLSVVFTPADPSDYTTATGATTLNVVALTPPHVTGVVGVGHSRKGLTSIAVAIDEALNPDSAGNPGLYLVLGAAKKHKETVHSKAVGIRSVSYDSKAHSVTINLAKPFKGAVQVTVHSGVVARNGASSSGEFTRVVQ